jgi:phage baseplate assembly protein W
MLIEQYKDLQLTRRGFEVLTSNRDYVSLLSEKGGDLDTVNGRNNMAQAIVNRLLTRRGELGKLGHPEYGSRLHELVGELNNLRLRALAELYIRDCLAQEKRIEKVRYIQFEPPRRDQERDTLRVTIGIKLVGETEEFSIIIPINI